MLAGSSIWSADCQSIAGSHFLQTGEYFTEQRKEKLMVKREFRIFGLKHHAKVLRVWIHCLLEKMLIRLESMQLQLLGAVILDVISMVVCQISINCTMRLP